MHPLIRSIKRKIGNYFRHSVLVEGPIKGSDQPFRCLFIDSESLFAQYMMQRAFSGSPAVLRRRRIYIPAIKKIVRSPSNGIDMCVAVLPVSWEPHFDPLCDYKTQESVRQAVDLHSIPDQTRVRRTYIETGNKIKRHCLSFRTTNELGDFRHFYEKMYLPLAKRQFGELSYIERYDIMLEIFKVGYLLQVLQDGKPIAGAVYFIRNDVMVGHSLGVLDGNQELTRIGVQSAVYYFGIQYAMEQGLKKMDFLTSRPFLGDGVYAHKRDWGATVYPDDRADKWVYLFFTRKTEKIVSFFENNPMIVHGKDGLAGLVGCEAGKSAIVQKNPGLKELFFADQHCHEHMEIKLDEPRPFTGHEVSVGILADGRTTHAAGH